MELLKIVNLNIKNSKESILEGINISINEGESVALLGESGCGKSILSKSIAGLLNISFSLELSGDLFFRGKKLNWDYLKTNQNKTNIMIIFQEYSKYLDHRLSVLKHFKELCPKNTLNEIKAELKKVKLPFNAEFLKTKVYYLSGGEKQRLMISLVMLLKSQLIILDEIFSSLDKNNRKNILEIIKNLQKERGFSIILISHNLEIVKKLSNKIYLIKDKKIIEENSTEEFFRNPKTNYAKEFLK